MARFSALSYLVIVVHLSASASGCATTKIARLDDDAQVQQPPAESPLLMTTLELRFPTQGNRALREIRTYVMQAETRRYVSLRSRGLWVPYGEAEPVILDDAERFWKSGRFESLWVDALEDPYENGVAGKRVIFNFVEQTDTVIPTADYPTPPPEYRQPPPGHERLYPPPEG